MLPANLCNTEKSQAEERVLDVEEATKKGSSVRWPCSFLSRRVDLECQ